MTPGMNLAHVLRVFVIDLSISPLSPAQTKVEIYPSPHQFLKAEGKGG